MRGEVIDDTAGGSELFDGVSIVHATCVGIEIPVAGGEIEVPGSVGGQASPALPNAPAAAVGGYVVGEDLLESTRVVAQNPTVPRRIVAVGPEPDVNHTVT